MLLDEVGAYLEAQAVGTVKTTANDPAWPIHKGGLYPGTIAHPDDAIGLLEGPGFRPLRQMDATVGAAVAEVPLLVLNLRSASYASGRAKAEAVWARQQPFPVGRDDKDRWIFGCNFDVTKEQS